MEGRNEEDISKSLPLLSSDSHPSPCLIDRSYPRPETGVFRDWGLITVLGLTLMKKVGLEQKQHN